MSSVRKWLLVLSAAGACLSVVLAASWVAVGRNRPGEQAADGKLLRGTPPNVVFAPGVTSGDPRVDAFISEFIDLCRRGDYEQYRLHWTAYGTPISGDRFAAMWKFTRLVHITRILAAPPDLKVMHPAYIVQAVAELDPNAKIASKDVEIMVQWEQDRWAIAPAPRLEEQASPVPDTQPDGHAAVLAPRRG